MISSHCRSPTATVPPYGPSPSWTTRNHFVAPPLATRLRPGRRLITHAVHRVLHVDSFPCDFVALRVAGSFGRFHQAGLPGTTSSTSLTASASSALAVRPEYNIIRSGRQLGTPAELYVLLPSEHESNRALISGSVNVAWLRAHLVSLSTGWRIQYQRRHMRPSWLR